MSHLIGDQTRGDHAPWWWLSGEDEWTGERARSISRPTGWSAVCSDEKSIQGVRPHRLCVAIIVTTMLFCGMQLIQRYHIHAYYRLCLSNTILDLLSHRFWAVIACRANPEQLVFRHFCVYSNFKARSNITVTISLTIHVNLHDVQTQWSCSYLNHTWQQR